MTFCEAMSERMPDVASGRERWTAEEAAHLAACAECRAEWALVQAVREMGRDAVPGLSPQRIADAALARVRAERASEERQRATIRAVRWGGLAAAAALMLAVLLRRPVDVPAPVAPSPMAVEPVESVVAAPESATSRPPVRSEPATAEFALELPLPELEDADAEELQAILEGLDTPLGEYAGPEEAL